jgi:hypothetical protein
MFTARRKWIVPRERPRRAVRVNEGREKGEERRWKVERTKKKRRGTSTRR